MMVRPLRNCKENLSAACVSKLDFFFLNKKKEIPSTGPTNQIYSHSKASGHMCYASKSKRDLPNTVMLCMSDKGMRLEGLI